ncbi:hypothetical protein [Candidatus Clostridium radicumherbarum]|uniref:Uncharacterized protein n=1 Tax=Candidatus Clostridium radicumherbarum TaxID=3381662 RepID=A0ABW8TXT7_9CLOT
MKITPVNKYKNPNYPTRRAVLENPEILRLLPNRWKNNIYAATALSTLLMITLSACDNTEKAVNKNGTLEKKALVAPIFEHGSGRGSFGCDSVAPPSFISEEEAFQVIQEEAKNYGISFDKSGLQLKNINLPYTNLYPEPKNTNGKAIVSTHMGSLKLDGFDEAKKIGFEFVSQIDYREWQKNQGMFSTVETYDFLSAAKVLRDGINENHGDTSVGVFYNPMISPQYGVILKDVEAKLKAEEELKQQVKDFFEWLKAQGII